MKKATSFSSAGFTLVEIMIVVAIIGLLAGIALPNFIKARAASQANGCINNLRKIDDAANQFAIEYHKTRATRSISRTTSPPTSS
jgi:prepilin-type N-terminal cleavage/methylation domain-containing protein